MEYAKNPYNQGLCKKDWVICIKNVGDTRNWVFKPYVPRAKMCKFLQMCKLESIEMKCVIYVKVNQACKRNWICMKKCYIVLGTVNKYVALFTYIIFTIFVAKAQHKLCICWVKQFLTFCIV